MPRDDIRTSGHGRYSIYTGRATNWPMVVLDRTVTVTVPDAHAAVAVINEAKSAR